MENLLINSCLREQLKIELRISFELSIYIHEATKLSYSNGQFSQHNKNLCCIIFTTKKPNLPSLFISFLYLESQTPLDGHQKSQQMGKSCLKETLICINIRFVIKKY